MIEFLQKRPLVALAFIIGIGLVVRLYLLPTAGFVLDLVQHYHWGLCATQNGWFGLCNCPTPVTHPPINPTFYGLFIALLKVFGVNISTFKGNGLVIAALKIHLIIFELALIGLMYYIVQRRAGVGWALAVTAALYWSPDWLVVTAWWGQNDASYSFFMLLAAYLLTRRQIRWVWLIFALAWLAKFQSIMFLPVFGVLSLRRYGLRATIEGVTLFALIFGGGLLPFIAGSGSAALNPFTGTVGLFPYITNGAQNMWFWLSGSSPTVLRDNLIFVAGLSYAQVGFFLLIIGTLLLCARAWLIETPDDVYLLFATANLIFFMLPTQIQVRYLYPGLMFLAVAMVKNWRLVAVYILLSITFMYNVFSIVWLGVGLLYYPFRLMFWGQTVTH